MTNVDVIIGYVRNLCTIHVFGHGYDYVTYILRTNGFIWITRAGGVIHKDVSTSSGWGSDAREVSDHGLLIPVPFTNISSYLDSEGTISICCRRCP